MPAQLVDEPRTFALARERERAPERLVRRQLREQIAALEWRLGELWASAYPRHEIDWGVGTIGGPRVLDVAELERVRDALAARLSEVQRALAERAEAQEESRLLLERMIAEPERYPWVRISNEHLGERGCRHWHSRPRLGLIGMLLGWWRVKLSSGCPLARGRGERRAP
ncbi:MAG TPA: hypothetical protein VIL04_11015 [Solirubrobacterales bacterium]|jgi:hypothetical protein